MICTKCNTFNRSTATYCKQCGNELIYTFDCPQCGQSLKLSDKICHECGYQLNQSKDLLDKDPYKDERDDYADTSFNLLEMEKRQEADVDTKKLLYGFILILSVILFMVLIVILT